MGCDIHEYVEVKINGKWVYVGGIAIGRNYALFSVLADVRNNGSVGCVTGEPRGIPENVDPVLNEISEDYGGDGHSHSHLYLNELVEAKKSYVKKFGDDEYWPKCLDNLESLKDLEGIEDVRFVFWFDN